MRTETTPQRTPGPPLLIGEAPPKAGLGPRGPFDCDSGDNLARWLSGASADAAACATMFGGSALGALRAWSRADALVAFERRNLLAEWPGPAKSGKGSAWPARDARKATEALAPALAGRRVVLAGSRVADAFGLALPPGAELRWRGAVWSQIPHPSGANRASNPAEVKIEAGRSLLRAIAFCAAEAAAEVPIAQGASYHFGRGQFLGDLAAARAALARASAWVFRWCSTSPVSDRAHEALCALRAWQRCVALDLPSDVALRSAAIALVHDRHEPLTGDLASPVKALLGADWRPCEQAAARAVADLYAGDAPDGSPLHPLADPAEEAAAHLQAHLADLDCGAIEAAWWVPHAHDRVTSDPLWAAAKAGPEPDAFALENLERLADRLDRAAWGLGSLTFEEVLRCGASTVPAVALPGGEVSLAR